MQANQPEGTMEIPRWEIVRDATLDNNALFAQEFEQDELVLFHISPAANLYSIAANGFRSAADLGIGELDSVSFYKSSRWWNTVTEYPAREAFVIFAVRFDTLIQNGIRVNESDIHVDCWRKIQPTRLAYCEIPSGYR